MAANQCNVFIMDEFTQQAISVVLLILYKVFKGDAQLTVLRQLFQE